MKSRTRCCSTRQLIFCIGSLFGAILLISLTSIAIAEGLSFGPIAWIRGAKDQPWPKVDRMELSLDLRNPPHFTAKGVLSLSGIEDERFTLLLNRSLEVEVATVDGAPVEVTHGPRLRSSYHREGRVVSFGLSEKPRGGAIRLELTWSGDGEDGTGTRDWRGILLLSPDEFRMSEQTVFYPQSVIDESGPGVVRAPGVVRVLAPSALEVFVPGKGEGPVGKGGDAREWTFEMIHPSVLSVMGGHFVRKEMGLPGAHLVSLLRKEHANLAEEMLSGARSALEFYESLYGSIEHGVLGIVEMDCLGSHSYNWTSQGVIVFDRGALHNGVPTDTIGHEVAHLWWGQEVSASGDGERFLTESLAEYSSWRFVESKLGESHARDMARDARRSYMDAVHKSNKDPALSVVTFSTKNYQTLAYKKGPLFLRYLEFQMGREAIDRGIRTYFDRHRRSQATLDDFVSCLDGGAQPVNAKSLLFEDGHGHFEIHGYDYDGSEGIARGRVVARECPSGIAGLIVSSVDLLLRSKSDSLAEKVFLQGGEGAFHIATSSEPELVVLDPDVFLPILEPRPISQGGARLVRTDPPNGSKGVPAGSTRVVLEFDRPLAPPNRLTGRELGKAIFDASRTTGCSSLKIRSVHLEEENRVVVLVTSLLLPGEKYLIPAHEVFKDHFGIPVSVSFLGFETETSDDRDPPVLASATPACQETGVDLNLKEIRLTFSEKMRPGRGFSRKEIPDDDWKFPPLGGSSWDASSRVLVYTLDEQLKPNTTYILPLRSAFRDWNNNPIQDFDYVFTTGE